MEDNIRFHKDIDYIRTMLSNMPETDVIMFDKMTCSAPRENEKYKEYVNTLPLDRLYGDMNGIIFIFCSCYALNRKAMQRIIAMQEDMLLPADTPINDNELTGSFAIVNVAIKDGKFIKNKNEAYDRIGLDTSNYMCYEVPKTASIVVARNNKLKAGPGPVKVVSVPEKKKIVVKTKSADIVKRPATKKPSLSEKVKRIHTRTIYGHTSGHNKLYDVY
jgi:hypothetical protein